MSIISVIFFENWQIGNKKVDSLFEMILKFLEILVLVNEICRLFLVCRLIMNNHGCGRLCKPASQLQPGIACLTDWTASQARPLQSAPHATRDHTSTSTSTNHIHTSSAITNCPVSNFVKHLSSQSRCEVHPDPVRKSVICQVSSSTS